MADPKAQSLWTWFWPFWAAAPTFGERSLYRIALLTPPSNFLPTSANTTQMVINSRTQLGQGSCPDSRWLVRGGDNHNCSVGTSLLTSCRLNTLDVYQTPSPPTVPFQHKMLFFHQILVQQLLGCWVQVSWVADEDGWVHYRLLTRLVQRIHKSRRPCKAKKNH